MNDNEADRESPRRTMDRLRMRSGPRRPGLSWLNFSRQEKPGRNLGETGKNWGQMANSLGAELALAAYTLAKRST